MQVARYGIDADLARRPHGLYTWSDASLPALRRELQAARDAGIVGAQLFMADELDSATGERPLPFAELPASMGVKAVLVSQCVLRTAVTVPAASCSPVHHAAALTRRCRAHTYPRAVAP